MPLPRERPEDLVNKATGAAASQPAAQPVIKQVARKLIFSPTIPHSHNILKQLAMEKIHNGHSVSQNFRAKREFVLARVFVSPVLSKVYFLLYSEFITPRPA